MHSITSISLENPNTLLSIMFVIFSIKSFKLLLDLLLGAYNVLLLQIGPFYYESFKLADANSVYSKVIYYFKYFIPKHCYFLFTSNNWWRSPKFLCTEF